MASRAILMLSAVLLATGCGGRRPEPSLHTPRDAAEADLQRMSRSPVPLRRPLVVLGGYFDWLDEHMTRQLLRCVEPTHVIHMHFRDLRPRDSLQVARAKLFQRLKAEGLLEPTGVSREVDVVGFSMGGVVARLAAIEQGTRRLKIARLFTICSPHRGAVGSLGLDGQQRDMAIGSPLLAWLNEADAARPYTLVAYAACGDTVVDCQRAAPPGVTPILVDVPGILAHTAAARDPRILADIARRLRGEPPLDLPAISPDSSAPASAPRAGCP